MSCGNRATVVKTRWSTHQPIPATHPDAVRCGKTALNCIAPYGKNIRRALSPPAPPPRPLIRRVCCPFPSEHGRGKIDSLFKSVADTAFGELFLPVSSKRRSGLIFTDLLFSYRGKRGAVGVHLQCRYVHYRGKYQQYSGNRHYSAHRNW